MARTGESFTQKTEREDKALDAVMGSFAVLTKALESEPAHRLSLTTLKIIEALEALKTYVITVIGERLTDTEQALDHHTTFGNHESD